MFIFYPYHALSSKAQVIVQVWTSWITHLIQKHQIPCPLFPRTTNMIYILFHAYNIVIHENKYLPRLGIGWSCPKSPKELFCFRVWNLEKCLINIQKGMRVCVNKNLIWGPLYRPQVILSHSFGIKCGQSGRMGHFALWALSCNSILGLNLGPITHIHLTHQLSCIIHHISHI